MFINVFKNNKLYNLIFTECYLIPSPLEYRLHQYPSPPFSPIIPCLVQGEEEGEVRLPYMVNRSGFMTGSC